MSEQSELKQFTRKGLADRNTKKDAVFVIDNIVGIPITKFLDDHPGGHEVLLNVAGQDASEDFDDVGYSSDAKEMMKKYIVGELVEEDKASTKMKEYKWSEAGSQANEGGSFLTLWKFPVVLGLVMTVLYSHLFG